MCEIKKRLVVTKTVTDTFGVVPEDMRMDVPLRQLFKFYLSEPELAKVFQDINLTFHVNLMARGYVMDFDRHFNITGATTINKICEQTSKHRTPLDE